MDLELSDELYVSLNGILKETYSNKEVVGLCLTYSEELDEAKFVYITKCNNSIDDLPF